MSDTTPSDKKDGECPSDDRRTVRVLEDVDTFEAIDGQEYDLRSGDVVVLPRDDAAGLIEQGSAAPIGEHEVKRL